MFLSLFLFISPFEYICGFPSAHIYIIQELEPI